MRHGWIALLFAACVVRVNTPFHLPPPDPEPEPAQARASEPAPQRASESPELRAVEPDPPEVQQRKFEERSRNEHRLRAGSSYDEVLGLIADGDQAAAEHEDLGAASSYQEAVKVSDELIGDVERDQDLTATYSTRTDGRIDRPTLLARAHEHRAHAAQLAERADARYSEALIAEFHPTPDQRKVLLDLGRPKVTQQEGHTCWVYLRHGVRETFCWTRSGEVADHTRVDEAAIARDRIAYYRLATFAGGHCSGDCSTGGWSANIPHGTSVSSQCGGNDCARRGWRSSYPEGTAYTVCRGTGCLQSGWTTQFPDGTRATATCNIGDCMKRGWATELSSHVHFHCSCSTDCRSGATCH